MSESNGRPDWKDWRQQALAALPLDAVYGEILTGAQQGPGWLEARDPRSPTGDTKPSCGVSDGTGDCERARFKSFRDSCNWSVFDFLVERGRASDYRQAQEIVADLARVPLPGGRPRRKRHSDARSDAGTAGQQAETEKPKEQAAYTFVVVDSAKFFGTNYHLEWLVRRVLVAKQPVLLGAPRKSLKTSIAIDLAISLASGTPFLGCEDFRVRRSVKVAILSGESGEAVIQETARRIAAAKGIEPATLPILWGFKLPQLAEDEQVDALADGVKEHKVEVLIIDPAYLCLLAGAKGSELNAANMFQIGPLLLSVAKACLEAGATPILLHHSRKNLADPFAPMELEDLAFSGFQEFARQWILLNRRERYEPGSGLHRLWLTVGGSAGQSGEWALEIAEGDGTAVEGGRRWEVSASVAADAREAAARKRESARNRDDEAKVLAALDRLDPDRRGATLTKIRTEAGISKDRVSRALTRLCGEGVLEEVELVVTSGKGGKQPAAGYRRYRDEGAK